MALRGTADVEFAWIEAADPRAQQARVLRYAVLYEPFGVAGDAWDAEIEGGRDLVALDADWVVGYACLVPGEGSARVRQVCVDPAFERSGIGSALMAEAEREALRLGAREVWLASRLSAEPFYLACGYHREGETFPSGSTGLPHVRMVKRFAR